MWAVFLLYIFPSILYYKLYSEYFIINYTAPCGAGARARYYKIKKSTAQKYKRNLLYRLYFCAVARTCPLFYIKIYYKIFCRSACRQNIQNIKHLAGPHAGEIFVLSHTNAVWIRHRRRHWCRCCV